eukprot:CAMPEP_0172840734 /NCGR_PEP_ID=MMETSP1075-20121228/29531_1 /TAXON_ID=2916 /ORGANISM="Ceratium fusus, Strain PA161109" /LENGTH=62 /DNA_ID=CAMNT_0013684619 /DNA_START=200 /DNA_END=385 /DNA_ORIENTATION=-
MVVNVCNLLWQLILSIPSVEQLPSICSKIPKVVKEPFGKAYIAAPGHMMKAIVLHIVLNAAR